MNTYKKNKHSVNNGLAVAITCPPARPSLARAQQRAFTLLEKDWRVYIAMLLKNFLSCRKRPACGLAVKFIEVENHFITKTSAGRFGSENLLRLNRNFWNLKVLQKY